MAYFVFMIAVGELPLATGRRDEADEYRVLTVGIAVADIGHFVTNWGSWLPLPLLTMLPMTIVFLFFQRWFVQASMAGALKQ